MRPILSFTALASLMLAGCTHFGTNVAGNFSCRAESGRHQDPGCRSLSEADVQAIRQLVKISGIDLTTSLIEARQRVGVASTGAARTGERTLKVVLPAHVDAAGTLHEEAVAWAVVEAARWAGELPPTEKIDAKGTMRALRQALKDQARRAEDASRKSDAKVNPAPVSPEDSAAANPFIPSLPLVLPSPGGEAQADVPPSAAGGSDMSPTPHERAPRPLEEVRRVWPSAAAIEVARKLKAQAEAKAAPKKEPK